MKARIAFSGFLAAVGLISLPLPSFGGGFSVVGVAARAQSMEAFTAVADDPSAIYYNPAGLTQISDTEVNANANYISSSLDYTNSLNQYSSSANDGVLAPSLFLASGDTAPVYLGLGVYAPFGRKNEYEINPAVYNLDQSSSIVRLDFVPTIAFKLGPYISLGASIVGSRIDAAANTLGINQVGHGYGVTGQGGVLVTLPKGVKLGVDYRGPEDGTISGTGTWNAPFGVNTDTFDASFRFPAVLSAGVSWQVVQQLLLSFDYNYEMWSYLDQITPKYTNLYLSAVTGAPVNGKNSNDFRGGLMYRPNLANEFRLGGLYVEKAVPAPNIIPSQPDFSGAGAAVGYSRYYRKWRFDIGYEYGKMFERTGTNTYFPGNYSGHLNTVLAGINYSIT